MMTCISLKFDNVELQEKKWTSVENIYFINGEFKFTHTNIVNYSENGYGCKILDIATDNYSFSIVSF